MNLTSRVAERLRQGGAFNRAPRFISAAASRCCLESKGSIHCCNSHWVSQPVVLACINDRLTFHVRSGSTVMSPLAHYNLLTRSSVNSSAWYWASTRALWLPFR